MRCIDRLVENPDSLSSEQQLKAVALTPETPVEVLQDNAPGTIERLLRENDRFRIEPWPEPFNSTLHTLNLGDARSLDWVESGSVHLIVTSPPYWTLKKYNEHPSQLGAIEQYEEFLDELDRAWAECARVLTPGGRLCCVVGDVCVPRRRNKGRHWVAPLHADIQVRTRQLGLDNLTPILWHKIANGATEAVGNGAGYYGKPYQPNGIIKNDIEYILLLRKGGGYRKPNQTQKMLSMINREEQRSWYRSIWTDIRGTSTRAGHPAPYPVELATRLIRMFSFAGDTILDPFLGAGSTTVAAIREGRNSLGNEIDLEYLDLATRNAQREINENKLFGATEARLQRRGEQPG